MRDFKEYALRLLKVRQRSEQELRRRLAQKGADEKQIDSIVEYLKQVALINDEEFACEFVQSKTKQHWSWLRIKNSLIYEFGISREHVETAIKCYNEQKVLEYYIEKFRHSKKDRNYVVRHLYAKGFSRDFIERVLKEL